jgi:hypothetical protein
MVVVLPLLSHYVRLTGIELSLFETLIMLERDASLPHDSDGFLNSCRACVSLI